MGFIKQTLTMYYPLSKKYLLGCIGVMFAGQVLAQTTNNDSDLVQGLVQIVTIIFELVTFLMTPAIIMAGWLLSPDWTMGDIFGLRPYFLQVWILVSNLTYIAFALLLLFMAVMQIFSGEHEFALKKKLPRFLTGILIVPFTWLIVSWTLSFANLAIASILSIPMGAITNEQTGEGSKLFRYQVIPTEIDLQFEDRNLLKCGSNGETPKKDGKGGIKCISPFEFFNKNDSGPFFIMLVYAYDIFRIQETDITKMTTLCKGSDKDASGNSFNAETGEGCIKSIAQLLNKVGMALVTYIFFGILVIGLCWVLLARAIKLWIYVMLSPLFGLAYALEDKGLGKVKQSAGGGGGGGGGGDGTQLGQLGMVPFFKLAMVPVLVSAVLAFGLLFVGVMRESFAGTSSSSTYTNEKGLCMGGKAFMVEFCLQKEVDASYSSKLYIGNTPGSIITFKFGSLLTGTGKKVASAGKETRDALSDIFAHGIISIMALVVIWMGIKAAVHHDEITKSAFAPFAKLGDAVGSAVKQAPNYMPLPHPVMKLATPGGARALGGTITRRMSEAETRQSRSLEEMISMPGIVEFSDNIKKNTDNLANLAAVYENARDEYINGDYSFKDQKKAILSMLNKTKSGLPEPERKQIEALMEHIDSPAVRNMSEIRTALGEGIYAKALGELKNKDDNVKRIFERLNAVSSGSGGGNVVFNDASMDGNFLKLDDRETGRIDSTNGNFTGDINDNKKTEVISAFRMAGITDATQIAVADPTKIKNALEGLLGTNENNLKKLNPDKRRELARQLFVAADGPATPQAASAAGSGAPGTPPTGGAPTTPPTGGAPTTPPTGGAPTTPPTGGAPTP